MKNVIKIILFMIILFALMISLGEVFYSHSENYEWNSMDSLYELPKNSVDVAFLGSSMFHHGFLHMEFFKNTGLTVLPVGAASERIEISYFKLKEIFVRQKPKLIVVDLFLSSGEENIKNEQELVLHYSIDLLRLNFNKIAAINSVIENKYKPYYIFKLLYYHTNWKTMIKNKQIFNDYFSNKENLIMKSSTGIFVETQLIQDLDENKMYQIKDEVNSLEDYQIEMYVNDTKLVNPYIFKIINLARENNCKIIFTCYPKVIQGYEIRRFEYLRKYLENETDIYFLDLNENNTKIGLNKNEDFHDIFHVNYKGAFKITNYISNYVKSLNIDFDDNKDKTIWNEAYKMYSDFLKEKNISFYK